MRTREKNFTKYFYADLVPDFYAEKLSVLMAKPCRIRLELENLAPAITVHSVSTYIRFKLIQTAEADLRQQ